MKRTSRSKRDTDIRINGSRPWDLHVHDERFYRRVLADASLGLGCRHNCMRSIRSSAQNAVPG